MLPLKSYLPYFYDGVREFDELLNSEQPEFDTFNNELKLTFKRQFVLTADEVGVSLYESILGIYPDPEDTLAWRKERIILQLNSSPPFTMQYLRNCLDKIIGKGNYKTWCNYNDFELYIQATVKNKNWFTELKYLLARIKPANLLYIYMAYSKNTINLTQRIRAGQGKWNYKLGEWRLGDKPFYSDNTDFNWNYLLGEWRLGEKPFGDDETELIKIGGIKPILLKDSAEYAVQLINSLLINNELVINRDSFDDIYVVDNLIRIETVLPATDIQIINNIKVLDENNAVLSEQSEIYIEKEEALRLVIEWEYREGSDLND